MSLSFKTEYLVNYSKSRKVFRLPAADVEVMHIFVSVIYGEVLLCLVD